MLDSVWRSKLSFGIQWNGLFHCSRNLFSVKSSPGLVWRSKLVGCQFGALVLAVKTTHVLCFSNADMKVLKNADDSSLALASCSSLARREFSRLLVAACRCSSFVASFPAFFSLACCCSRSSLVFWLAAEIQMTHRHAYRFKLCAHDNCELSPVSAPHDSRAA